MENARSGGTPRRKRTRLFGFDYSVPGSYFVTACTQARLCLFGSITGTEMIPNPVGIMIESWWLELKNKYPHIDLDRYRVMPNHIHGIIGIMEPEGSPHRGSPTLDEMYGWFSTMTTNEYIRRVREDGWKKFPGRLWQRSFFDHIIRNEDELARIRYYIETNPERWNIDTENPGASSRDDFDFSSNPIL